MINQPTAPVFGLFFASSMECCSLRRSLATDYYGVELSSQSVAILSRERTHGPIHALRRSDKWRELYDGRKKCMFIPIVIVRESDNLT